MHYQYYCLVLKKQPIKYTLVYSQKRALYIMHNQNHALLMKMSITRTDTESNILGLYRLFYWYLFPFKGDENEVEPGEISDDQAFSI